MSDEAIEKAGEATPPPDLYFTDKGTFGSGSVQGNDLGGINIWHGNFLTKLDASDTHRLTEYLIRRAEYLIRRAVQDSAATMSTAKGARP